MKQNQSIARNPRILRYYMAFSEAFVTMSVLVVFFAHKGVSFTQFLWIQSIFSIALLLLDVPAGYLTDRFSRKGALILGSAIVFLGYAGLLLGDGFWQMVYAEIVLAVGRSLMSGTASAMLYDGLLSQGKESSYNYEEGKMKSWMAYALGLAGLVGSFLYPIHPDLPQLLSCVMMLCSLCFAFFLVEPPVHKSHAPESPIKEMRAFILYAVRGHEEIPWLILYSGVICGGTMLGTWLTQPYWEAVGVPIWMFGALFCTTQIARGFSLAKASVVLSCINNKVIGIALVALLCIGFIMQGIINHPVGIILTLFPAVIYGFCHIMILGLINKRVESRMRATVLSTESVMWRLVFAIAAPFIGYFHDMYGLSNAFLASGIFWLIIAIPPLYMLHRKAIL